ncbi:VOC family protein [Actinoplanes sp. NPDC089786]|uniref:VOC family protein n=1 Tax=Actinoplanes sp. NPDC089786 TaxID=3155185 RepID=UPI00343A83A0
MGGVRWLTGFLDAQDRSAEDFWCAVTGSSLSARRGGGRFATLVPADGDAYLRVQVTSSPGPASCHLDLHGSPVVPPGGRLVLAEGDLSVYRSPAGLPFCVVPASERFVRPGPVGGALVDQMCLDVPEALFEREAEFWASLTGFTRRPSDLPEFEVLERGEGLALRVLMQRTGGPAAGMHLDFAAEDVAATVARHVGLGASVVRRVPGQWTTLRDPAGREYCVTARSPGLS